MQSGLSTVYSHSRVSAVKVILHNLLKTLIYPVLTLAMEIMFCGVCVCRAKGIDNSILVLIWITFCIQEVFNFFFFFFFIIGLKQYWGWQALVEVMRSLSALVLSGNCLKVGVWFWSLRFQLERSAIGKLLSLTQDLIQCSLDGHTLRRNTQSITSMSWAEGESHKFKVFVALIYRRMLSFNSVYFQYLAAYQQKQGYMSMRFEKLVKHSAVKLTQYVYSMITYIQVCTWVIMILFFFLDARDFQ